MSDLNKSNRLIHEKSPYLLQHAHNPVDWYPWGEEAFRKARTENKPIFLSIGYSTCHWCHVMEEESFTQPKIAKLLNQYFVSIKVDREERPDVDQVYMQSVQAMSGSGGWPMSVFLTNDLKPFYGGTYFPPEDRWGRPGFTTVLEALHKKWTEDRAHLEQAADDITRHLRERSAGQPEKSMALGEETQALAFNQLLHTFDTVQGGFGSAPKFPRSHDLSFLLRYGKRTGDAKARVMVEKTLEAMARGGIYDHLGGGFHRYSTDARWHVPHFEKMLYDQAILARTYLEAAQVTGKSCYRKQARHIFGYVLRDMRHANGAFYSAEDADSVADRSDRTSDNAVPDSGGGSVVSVSDRTSVKKEGAFYVWTQAEIEKILGPDRAPLFNEAYGVASDGNAENDPHAEFTGKNILFQSLSAAELAVKQGKGENEIEALLEGCRADLLKERLRRPRPHLDDKILTDWNGLMISSLAFGARVLNEPALYAAAKEAADFILSALRRPDGRLLHRWREGERMIPGFLDDYAFLIYGLIDLYQAGFDAHYLEAAQALTEQTLALFSDPQGGFLFSARDGERMLYETKELYDGALPSGNSIMTLNLIRLARLLAEPRYERAAEANLEFFSSKITQYPSGFTQMLIALDYVLGPSREIVVAGTRVETEPFIGRFNPRFVPNAVLLLTDASAPWFETLKKISPFAAAKVKSNNAPAAYVCRSHVCDFPVTDPDAFEKLLEDSSHVPA